MEDPYRRLDELNAEIDVISRDLRKLVAERDRLEQELGAREAVTAGDPIEEGPAPSHDFVVPWAPEEDRL